jgi:CHAT domain-containing protein
MNGTFIVHRSSVDMRISALASSASQTRTPVRVLAILAITLGLLAAGIASANESRLITELQGKFRQFGGTVAPIEGKLGSDYRFPGRPARPFAVADVLGTLREAHLAKAIESKGDVWHLLSALSANRAGRDLLQLERDHTSLLDAAARRRVSSALRDFYDAEIDLGWVLLDTSRTEDVDPMFRAAELSRARDFMGSVYRRMDLGGRPSEERAFAQFEALVGYREALAAMRGYMVTSATARAYLSVLERSLSLRSGNPDSNDLARFDKPSAAGSGVMTASNMTTHVGIGEVLIVYHVTASRAYAFVLVRNVPPRFIRLPGSTATLRERARTYHAQLSSGPTERGVIVVPGPKQDSWRDTGYKLYETLIQPLEPYLGRADRLLIVPHDLIHLVPFAALPTSKGKNSAFLVDRYPTAVLPTPMFRGWNSMRRREPTKLAMVVGNNDFTLAGRLKYAEEEARSIAGLLGGSDLLLGSRGQATYRNVVDNMASYSIVHIASHGLYIPAVPGAAHVLLRGRGRQDDEPLMAVDVLGTRLNASLIVLSACQTATPHEGGLPPDGDILGLPRSFLIAGARAVIASLWAVNDESTRKFFQCLYRTAFSGSPSRGDVMLPNVELDVALANAQRRIRSEYMDPHYWAPFILIGE